MTWKTHILGGLLAGTYICSIATSMSMPTVVTVMTLSVIGSLFPDIDIPTSKIGASAKPISTLVSLTTGHRGMFHAPLLYLVAYFILYHLYPDMRMLSSGFFFGCMSHLALDSLNVQGIPIMWPFKSKLSLMRIRLGGAAETAVRVFMLAAIIGILFLRKYDMSYGQVLNYVRNMYL